MCLLTGQNAQNYTDTCISNRLPSFTRDFGYIGDSTQELQFSQLSGSDILH